MYAPTPPAPRELTVHYAGLRRRDQIVRLGLREVDPPHVVEAVTRDGRVRLVNPTGSDTEHYLYPDNPALQEDDSIRVLRPPPPSRVRHFGRVTLIGTSGQYRTPGGRYFVWTQDFLEPCEGPHPIRTSRGQGVMCEGGQEHYLPYWTVWDNTIDNYLTRSPDPVKTLREAVAMLDQHGDLDNDTTDRGEGWLTNNPDSPQ